MRALQVIFAYIFSAFVGSFSLMLIGYLLGDSATGMFWTLTFAYASVGLFWASIVALPVLLFTEVKRIANWQFYVIACAFSAPAFLWMTGSSMTPAASAFFGFGAAVAGATYWLIAWRIFPPIETAEERQIS